jgi:hypothetical protein
VGSQGGAAQAEWRRGSPSGGSKRGGRAAASAKEAVASVGEERAPVSGGAVLRLEVEAREVAVARRQSGEGIIVGGGQNSATGGGSVLKGSSGEGARRGGRRMEAEREGERGGLAWHGAAQRGGVGAAAARPRRARAARCRATVESGGVGAMRGDVSDRWAGAPWCFVRQQLGAAWGNAVRRSARRGQVGSVAQCA